MNEELESLRQIVDDIERQGSLDKAKMIAEFHEALGDNISDKHKHELLILEFYSNVFILSKREG